MATTLFCLVSNPSRVVASAGCDLSHLVADVATVFPADAPPVQLAPQVLALRLLDPTFAASLAAAAVRCESEWTHQTVHESHPHPLVPGVTREVHPESTIDMGDMALSGWFRRSLAPRVARAAGRFWPSFRPAPWKFQQDGWILGYWPGIVKGMETHHDAESVSFVVPLTRAERGTGTHFPRWNFTATEVPPGTAVIYPGGLSHAHRAPDISASPRLVLIGSFFSINAAPDGINGGGGGQEKGKETEEAGGDGEEHEEDDDEEGEEEGEEGEEEEEEED